MDISNPVEISLQELEMVNRKLAVLSNKPNPPSMQITILIKEAQAQFAILERFMRDHPALIAAQIGLLEAAVLANSKPKESLRSTHSNLHWFMESMGR